jgi:HSP20 family protein
MSIALYNRNVMPTLFREFFNDAALASRHETTVRGYAPVVDIQETGDVLSFTFELPGVAKEDIKLEYKDGILTLNGEKPAPVHEEGVQFYARERRTGPFGRSFRIGTNYDPGTVAARYDNGLLHVTIQKKEAAKPVSIQVQ